MTTKTNPETKRITLYTKPIPINQKFFVHRGQNILSSKYRDTKLALQYEIAAQANFEPLSTPLAVKIDQYFGDRRKRDIDAYLKITLDAMEGYIYENDNQIIELHTTKHYDKENPRMEIEVSVV